jgi:hypothetical protein
MKIRVIDQSGNKQDFEADYAPRIGECFMLTYTTGNATTATNHYFRVKDAMYLLDYSNRAAILVEELHNPPQWFDE